MRPEPTQPEPGVSGPQNATDFHDWQAQRATQIVRSDAPDALRKLEILERIIYAMYLDLHRPQLAARWDDIALLARTWLPKLADIPNVRIDHQGERLHLLEVLYRMHAKENDKGHLLTISHLLHQWGELQEDWEEQALRRPFVPAPPLPELTDADFERRREMVARMRPTFQGEMFNANRDAAKVTVPSNSQEEQDLRASKAPRPESFEQTVARLWGGLTLNTVQELWCVLWHRAWQEARPGAVMEEADWNHPTEGWTAFWNDKFGEPTDLKASAKKEDKAA